MEDKNIHVEAFLVTNISVVVVEEKSTSNNLNGYVEEFKISGDKIVGNYKNGKKHGNFYHYSKNGNVTKKQYYNGKRYEPFCKIC
uniref:MORN repeat protein n=1 Tax=viral metagenome TaxID=1070528 RepID=A0A6C0AE35_9ZZZZ